MLQVREKKGWLRMEEEGYQGKWNEKKEERALGTQNDRKSKNEREERALGTQNDRKSKNEREERALGKWNERSRHSFRRLLLLQS
jgi:hypothetical protein